LAQPRQQSLGPQEIHLYAIPGKTLPSLLVFDGYVQITGDSFQARECWCRGFSPQPKPVHVKILQNSRQAADVVLMCMRQGHCVEPLKASRP
jgi:hypothetical protein